VNNQFHHQPGGRARRFGEGRLTSEIRGQDPEYILDGLKSVSYCSLLFEELDSVLKAVCPCERRILCHKLLGVGGFLSILVSAKTCKEDRRF
jgi:hypothetical protein